ncbi:MAG: extracellular solute-binding protein [Candidatus Izemoplasmatales bacterium]|nr:extracellular solute-binding protein [Candidatus Izemoplasmatales bacterium]
MKKLLSIFVSLIVLLTLVACTTTLAADVVDFSLSQEKVTTITVWLDDSEGLFMADLIPAFNAVYPNIEVQFQHMGALDSRDRLKTYGVSGNGADVFMFPHDHLSLAILEDLVYPLPNELFQSLNTKILDVAMDIATAGTRNTTNPVLYAVPISIESIFIMYNKTLISEEEVANLTSWNDIIDYSATFAAANPGKQLLTTNSHWADNYYIQTIYSAFGWRPHGIDGIDASAVGFESQALTSALTWLTTELKPVVTGNNSYNSVATSYFEQGSAAMIIIGPWAIKSFEERLGADNLGAMAMPTFDGVEGATYTPSTFAGSQMVAVYKYSQNKEAAIAFVQFLATEEAQQILYRTSNDCPALLDLSGITSTSGTNITDDKYMKVMIAQLQTSIPMPTISAVTYYWAAAETMVKNIWDQNADIQTEQKKAEASYLASKALGS